MKKVIIHVGQYKTGSTSIQKLMWLNRNELLSRGVLYPQSFVRDFAHFLITDLLRKDYRNPIKKVKLDPLREEIQKSSANTAVISCESLSGATVRWFAPEMMRFMWQRLVEVFDGFDVRVVFYVRRQDESINSRIIQEIKGQAKKASIEYESFLYKKSSMNYSYFYGLLEQVFGSGKIDVRLYDRRYLANTDVRFDFLEYLDLETCGLSVPISNENAAPSSKLIGFYRVINSLNLEANDYTLLTNGIWRELSSDDSPRAVIIGSRERANIMGYFRESNIRFIENCVPETNKKDFYETFIAEPMMVDANVSIDVVEVYQILRNKGYILSRQ